MFNGAMAWRPWFTDAEVDSVAQVVRSNGGVHLIIQSSEGVTADAPAGQQHSVVDQWNTVKFFARRYPDLTITFEIGNEPDHYFPNDPEATRDRYMRCVQYCRSTKPSNVRLGVSNCLGGWTPNIPNYFDRFNVPGQYGSPIHDVDIVCIHLYARYSPFTFCPTAPEDPLHILRWVRAWNAGKTIFVTEAGIVSANEEANPTPSIDFRAPRYVDLANKLQQWSISFGGSNPATTGQGWCDVACFYYVGYSAGDNGQYDPRLRINEQFTAYIGPRTAASNC